MEKFGIAALTFPILMGFLVYQYRKELTLLAKSKLINDVSGYELLIIILSARDHFVQRQTIRDTWWQRVTSNHTLSQRVRMRFIVGSSECLWPPEDLLDQYSCQPWTPQQVQTGNQHAARVEQTQSESSEHIFSRNYCQQYITFKVDHPVLISHLGLREKSVVHGAKVSLLEAVTQKVIASVQLNTALDGEVHEGFVYKPIDTYLLPKGFEGVISGENLSSSRGRLPCPQGRDNSELINSSMLHFPQYDGPTDEHYEDIFKWKAKTIPIVSFSYSVSDPDSLETLIQTREERQKEWESRRKDTESRLLSEQEQHGDLVIVDMLDTYRNLSLKLLNAFTWAANTEGFQYVMKTDDDCYVDVARVMGELSSLQQAGHTHSMWWGRFRHNWAVEVHGKWSERVYSAPVYPQFSCGVGYVISHDIAVWLSVNSEHLHVFQGEDISMGIWLAGLNVQYIEDPMWQCESDCISEMYATPDLNEYQLQQMWLRVNQCGDPCGCS